VEAIYAKVDGAMTKRDISAAVNVICDCIGDTLVKDGLLTISNFGTLSTYMCPGHDGVNIKTGKLEYVKPMKRVRFHSATVFSQLLNQRKKTFL